MFHRSYVDAAWEGKRLLRWPKKHRHGDASRRVANSPMFGCGHRRIATAWSETIGPDMKRACRHCRQGWIKGSESGIGAVADGVILLYIKVDQGSTPRGVDCCHTLVPTAICRRQSGAAAEVHRCHGIATGVEQCQCRQSVDVQ